jgi:hypothetical protein
MVDRRKVLKLGAAGIAGVLVDVPIGAWGVMSGAFPNALYRAVFDERFEEGRAFANELRHRGVVTSGIRGDVAPKGTFASVKRQAGWKGPTP